MRTSQIVVLLPTRYTVHTDCSGWIMGRNKGMIRYRELTYSIFHRSETNVTKSNIAIFVNPPRSSPYFLLYYRAENAHKTGKNFKCKNTFKSYDQICKQIYEQWSALLKWNLHLWWLINAKFFLKWRNIKFLCVMELQNTKWNMIFCK